MEYRIHTPLDKNGAERLKKMRAGDTVLLSGIVYTARDQGHRRMQELLEQGKTLPFSIEGSAIYYVGPTPEREGMVIGSAGPTTSGRMDAYSPALIALGNRIMIGKGKRGPEVKQAIIQYGAVYLGAPGGAGALMASCVKANELMAWEDLGCEALRRLTVENMPLTVVMDSRGNDLYETGPEDYLRFIRREAK